MNNELSAEEVLLKAAETEFLEKGYAGARTTHIAQLAGMSHSMLHYYYRTKEQLFNKVLENKFKIFTESVQVFLANGNLPILERIRAMVGSHFDKLAENQMVPRFVLNELVSYPERAKYITSLLQSLAKSFIPSLQEDLDKAYQNGEIVEMSAVNLLFDILSVNTFTFMVKPLATQTLFKNQKQYLQMRKQENIELIIKRIQR